MKKNIIKTIAFILAFGALPAEMVYANPLDNPPVGEVTHSYEDTHGRHTVRYEAHTEGTLKKLRYLKIGGRFLGLAGLAGGAASTMATLLMVGLGSGMAISGGGNLDELVAPAAIGAGIVVASGALGIKSLFHAQKAARMLGRHAPHPMFSRQSLENPVLKNGSFEWFVKSKETMPIYEQINTNRLSTSHNKSSNL